jgi:hypothetical protein
MARIDDLRSEAELNAQILSLTTRIAEVEATRAAAARGSPVDAGLIRRLESLHREAEAVGALSTATTTAHSRMSQSTRSTYNSMSSDVSGAASTVTGAIRGMLNEVAEASDRVAASSSERRQLVRDLAEDMGGSSQLYINNARDAMSAARMSAEYMTNLQQKTAEYYESLSVEQTEGITATQAKLINGVNTTNTAFMNAQGAATSFYGLITKKVREPAFNDDMFKINGTYIDVLFGNLGDAFRATLGAALSDPMLRNMYSADFLGADVVEGNINKYTASVTTALRGLGLTQADMASFVRQNFIMSGKATLDYFDDFRSSTEAAAQTIGVDARLITNDIRMMMNDSATFGIRSAEDFAKISASSRKVMMDVTELKGVMNKFDTFESAANSVGQLNMLLGTNLDAVDLMQKRYNDIPGFIASLQEGLQSGRYTFDQLRESPALLNAVVRESSLSVAQLRVAMTGNAEEIKKLQDDLMAKTKELDNDQESLRKASEARVQFSETELAAQTARMENLAKQSVNVGLTLSSQAQAMEINFNKLVNDNFPELIKGYEQITTAALTYNESVGETSRIVSGLTLKTAGETISSAVKSSLSVITVLMQTQHDELVKALSALTEDQDETGKLVQASQERLQRIEQLAKNRNFYFAKIDIRNNSKLNNEQAS